MQYAVEVINFGEGGDARALADLAREAESAGWDGFFIWDTVSLPWPVDVVDVTVALTAIALATGRIRFGAMMTPLPRRSPAKLARETASLDRLSGGRLIVGAVIGTEEECAQIGPRADARTRAAMLDEGLEVLTGLWRGEPFSYEGEYVTLREVAFRPTPVQQPRIPIWTGGAWPHRTPFKRAARWDGVHPMVWGGEWDDALPPEAVREIVGIVRAQRETDAPFDVAVSGHTPGDDPAAGAATVAAYERAGATWWCEGIHGLRFDGSRPALEAMRERIGQGPPRG